MKMLVYIERLPLKDNILILALIKHIAPSSISASDTFILLQFPSSCSMFRIRSRSIFISLLRIPLFLSLDFLESEELFSGTKSAGHLSHDIVVRDPPIGLV